MGSFDPERMDMAMKLGSLVGAALMLWMLAALGCGGPTVDLVEVSGTVTVDGEPVPQGTVTFVSADGSTPTGGGVIQDGAYTAKTPPGEKVVLVLGTKVVGQEQVLEGVPDSGMRDKVEMVTAPAYNAAHLTPLKASITGPQQGLNFELTKDVPAP